MPVLEAHTVIESLKAAASSNPSSAQLLQITAHEVRQAGAPYTSVYLYMLNGQDLILEAFSGRETDHKIIQVGHGVCGTAVAEGRDQNVGDVKSRSNYIACNLFTKSELVVLIRKDGKVIGQIDVDSDHLDPFSEDEEAALRLVADALGALL